MAGRGRSAALRAKIFGATPTPTPTPTPGAAMFQRATFFETPFFGVAA